jgi:hypothetical protein
MCVGIESWENEDVPFWPQVNTATYKEVWTHSALRWLWIAADAYGSAIVDAYLPYVCGERLVFKNTLSGQEYAFEPEYKTGKVSCKLPAGRYAVRYNGTTVNKTLVAAKRYEWEGLIGLQASHTVDGDKVVISVEVQSGGGAVSLSAKAENIVLDALQKSARHGETVTFTGTVTDKSKPWVALLVPDGCVAEAVEVYGV